MNKHPRTVDDLYEKVWREHWNTERYLASGWAKEVHNLYHGRIKPTFGKRIFKTVTADKIFRWHNAAKDTPTSANRALEVFTKLFTFANQRGWGLGVNPAKAIRAHTEGKRKRFATPDEIKRLAELLERESAKFPVAVAFIYTLLFTGARPRSLERALWDDLDIVKHNGQQYGVLTFHGKTSDATGEEEQVIIPPQALKLIDSNNILRGKPLLFDIKMPRRMWAKVKKEAGIDDLWARDLRRTFAVVALSNGVSGDMIGELLNHKSAETTKRYLGLLQDKRMDAVGTVATHMENLIQGK